MRRTWGWRRLVAWVLGALAAATVALGTTGCGSSDNGGVIEGPTTTAAPRTGASY